MAVWNPWDGIPKGLKPGTINQTTGYKPSPKKAATGRSRGASGSSMRPKNAPYDPMQAYLDLMGTGEDGGGGGGSGGGGGGGYGGDPLAALRAQIARTKQVGGDRYNQQNANLKGIYGQLADELRPNADATKQRYADLMHRTEQAGAGIAQETNTQQANNNAQRDAGLATLGVSPEAVAASPSAENVATQEGNARLAESNASWGNLQGVLGAAQESRDKLDVQGASDAGVLAQKELQTNYEAYLRKLDEQIISAEAEMAGMMSGGGGGGSSGGGGGGSSGSNKMLEALQKAQQNDLLDQIFNKGNYKIGASKAGSTRGGSAALSRVLGKSGINKNTGRGYTASEIYAMGGPQAAAEWKLYK